MPWQFSTENGGILYSQDFYKFLKSVSSSIAGIMWKGPQVLKQTFISNIKEEE